MAKVKHSVCDARLTVSLELDEAEVRALDGIFGYNVEVFLRVFYERMGTAYVKPHEAGVRSLHATIRAALSGPIAKVDAARRALKDALTNAAA